MLSARASYSGRVLFHAFAQTPEQARKIGGYRLFKDLPVEPGCSRDGEPVGLDVEEHERAVVAPAGEIEAGDDQG